MITAKLKLGQSITHWAYLDYQPGVGQPGFDDVGKNDKAKATTKIKR